MGNFLRNTYDRTSGKALSATVAIVAVLVVASPCDAQPIEMNVACFDGKSGFIELPRGMFDNLTEATVEAWVRWERFNKWSRVWDFGREGTVALVQNEKTGRNVIFSIHDRKGKRHRTRKKNAAQAGVWVHVAAMCGPGGMELYINGIQVANDG